MITKKKALGRGLSALLENADTDISASITVERNVMLAGSVNTLSLNQIDPNPFQPRTQFDKQALLQLSDSIKRHGIIQPVTVRKMGYDKFQIISGERRFKAAQLAGLDEIPVFIRVANDQAMLEMSLVENIQREDLNAIEIAISYQRLIEECKLTQEALSEKVSKQRSTVSNYLRLLKLPAEIQVGLREKKISMGHARALINIQDIELQMDMYRQIVDDNMSVRQVEQLAKAGNKDSRHSEGNPLSFEHRKMQEDLSMLTEKPVQLKRKSNGKGQIVIPFGSDDDLKRIIDILGG